MFKGLHFNAGFFNYILDSLLNNYLTASANNYQIKKLFLFLFALCLFTSLFASSEYYLLNPKADETFLTLGNGQKISLLELSTIHRKNFEKLSGRKLNIVQRAGIKIIRNKLKKSIEPDGTIRKGKLIQFLESGPAKGFHAIGFVLGLLFFAPAGLILSYVLKGKPAVRKNRIKWAWIGLGIGIIILVSGVLIYSGEFANL